MKSLSECNEGKGEVRNQNVTLSSLLWV